SSPGTCSTSRRATGFSGASSVELAPKFANTVLLRVQTTRIACSQEVFAGRCHARVMTPSLGAAVSTTVPESHGAKRDRAVLTNLLLAPTPERRLGSKRKPPISRAFYGRYWARTSDPQLVEPAGRYADVRACSRLSLPLQVFSRASTPRFSL